MIVCVILKLKGQKVGILVLHKQKMGFGHYLMGWLAGGTELCLVSAKRNDISTTFLQQILSGRLLLVVIVKAKK